MSNQGHPPVIPPHLPVHVRANLGTEDTVVPFKQFATVREAQAWIDQMKIERLGAYWIIDEMELDPFA
jgi:hypothetical protein